MFGGVATMFWLSYFVAHWLYLFNILSGNQAVVVVWFLLAATICTLLNYTAEQMASKEKSE